MLRRLLACSALLGAVACGEPTPAPATVTLRVGASGLSSFQTRSFSGDTAHAMELVYSLLSEHAGIEPLGIDRVVLRPKPSTPGSGAFLCERLLDDKGVVVRRIPAADSCILEFTNSEARAAFESYPWNLLDHGPFRWERERDDSGREIAHIGALGGNAAIDSVELVSRGSTAVDRIVITAMPLHEAWRRLFAHELDVIPNMAWLYRPHFAGMRSVRTIEIPASAHLHLFFNTRLPGWANPELRRHVASIVEPAAVAEVACGDPDCAVTAWKPAAPAAPVDMPDKLTIRVLSAESSAVTAAQAISYRIRLQHQVEIEVEPVSIGALAAPQGRTDYALVLAPMAFLTTTEPSLLVQALALFAGYEDPAFIDAARGGDAAEMQRILERDVPALPLYELRTFAAVDARFCGGHPTTATSWAWLADLHPCNEEDAP